MNIGAVDTEWVRLPGGPGTTKAWKLTVTKRLGPRIFFERYEIYEENPPLIHMIDAELRLEQMIRIRIIKEMTKEGEKE